MRGDDMNDRKDTIITLTINGQETAVPSGTSLLEACASAGALEKAAAGSRAQQRKRDNRSGRIIVEVFSVQQLTDTCLPEN